MHHQHYHSSPLHKYIDTEWRDSLLNYLSFFSLYVTSIYNATVHFLVSSLNPERNKSIQTITYSVIMHSLFLWISYHEWIRFWPCQYSPNNNYRQLPTLLVGWSVINNATLQSTSSTVSSLDSLHNKLCQFRRRKVLKKINTNVNRLFCTFMTITSATCKKEAKLVYHLNKNLDVCLQVIWNEIERDFRRRKGDKRLW